MPFAYYGAKHGLAPKYPKPRHRVVVEPFAGSAAYSVYHAQNIDHAILIDADERLVDLWHEIQTMTERDVDLIGRQLEGERFTHRLILWMAGSGYGTSRLDSHPVTSRMRKDWPSVSARIKRALPYVKRWTITHGSYTDSPDIDATWFVDPPYQQNGTMAGAGYRCSAADIDFADLAKWCRSRRGQTIVCEQSPASWLPFHPFATQANAAGIGTVARQEVVWLSDVEYLQLFDMPPNPQEVNP